MQYSIPQSRPLIVSRTAEMQVYALFALAMGLTAIGTFIGSLLAATLLRGGIHFILLLAEIGIIVTARLWMEKSPLNILLFGLFPLLSGVTLAPYLWYVSMNNTNGNAILLNALAATTFMAGAAAAFARTTSMDLSAMGRFLLLAILGLLGLALLQLFIPAFRQSIGFEMALSGGGVLLFAAFTAYDIQRVKRMSRTGVSPFLLALSLYLDIFNLFLFILRFMVSLSGQQR